MGHPVTLAGETLSGDTLQSFGGLGQPYTPSLTSSGTTPNLGTGGSITGTYWESGGFIDLKIRVQFGSSGVVAGTGTYLVSLPPLEPAHSSEPGYIIGRAVCADSSPVARHDRDVVVDTTARILFRSEAGVDVQATTPFTWAANDFLLITARYRRSDA